MRSLLFVVGAAAALLSGAASADIVTLQNATATFSQTISGNFFANRMIDGDFSGAAPNGWAIFDGGSSAQSAVFETAVDLTAPALEINLFNNYFQVPHVVGRYRISITTDARSDFADGLQSGGDVTANWTVISPLSMILPAGTTSSLLGDGSVLLGGVAQNGTYSGTYALPFGGITGIRLEVLEDPSLPTGGPGRFPDNGNFVLTEFTVNSVIPTPAAAATLAIAALFGLRRRR